MSSPEKINFNPEQKHDARALEQAGAERREALRRDIEKAGENPHENLERARRDALEKASGIEHEKRKVEVEQRPPSPAERRAGGPVDITERDASFNATMKDIRTHMSPSSRAFSKVIHNKAVEKASDIGASTIARPDAILSGAIAAFIFTLAIYLIAKNLGYPLSGFETIGAFILGWVLGVVYDFLKVMITGKK